MTSVRLQDLSKRFDRTVAVDRLSLDIAAGELFFLLGPSGCGKSTLLRLIAGLYEPDGGRIFFNDRDVTRQPTSERNAVMCFQSYALWPHLSVRENVRFGLNVRGLPRQAQRSRVEEVLALVRMSEYADRKPNQLSGGQQQRVALARALAVEPACLLLDEPLSNLDAKLRHEMRSEIRRICKTSGLTTIYVTHDQKEALSVADRIAIMRGGKLAQVGSPSDLYFRPHTSFIADFIGQTNLIRGQISGQEGPLLAVRTALGTLRANLATDQTPPNGEVVLSVRPEKIRLTSNGAASSNSDNQIEGNVTEANFMGDGTEYVVDCKNQQIKVFAAGMLGNANQAVTLQIDPQDLVVLPE